MWIGKRQTNSIPADVICNSNIPTVWWTDWLFDCFLIYEAKLVAVGYGIKKLQIMMTIVDDLVSVDTLIEEHLTVEPANEYIQSCDIVAFNKICKYIFSC